MHKLIPASFRRQVQIVLILLGILPLLLTTYVFIREGLYLSATVIVVTLANLLLLLAGYMILRSFSSRLDTLIDSLNQSTEQKGYKPLPTDDPMPEIQDISVRFNQIIAELDQSKKNFADITVALMKQAKDATTDYENRITESKTREDKLRPYIGIKKFEEMIHSKIDGELHLNSRRHACILFADIRGFTSITEREEPEEVVSMLNEYFEQMVEVIHNHNGILDKFIGDELMAVFGLLPNANNPSVDALYAAVEMQVVISKLMRERRDAGKITFNVGVGINAGSVVAGDIGSEQRRDYTVIGDSVNVASRLVHLAEGNEILISSSVYQHGMNHFHVERMGKTSVKNREQKVEYFKIIGRKT